MQHAKDYGLSAEKIGFDTAAVVERSRGVAKQLSDGVGFLMKKNKVDVIWGDGASIDAARQGHGEGRREPAPKDALGRALSGEAHHRRDRRAAARAARASSRTRS